MANAETVRLTIDNQTSQKMATGTISLDWGNKVNFESIDAYTNNDSALFCQGESGTWTGTEGTATWTINGGTLTFSFNDPYSGDPSVSVSGDAVFNDHFTATVGSPGTSGDVRVTATVKPK
jgi:hypothetical protein